ncbi:serine hydrolase domain-containing protein [Paraburkholderia tropica]|uniref:serine hydrolase domain-containing protein n=1 Tax=Paraburkholderia tropica TaxID=92647 RepID=UPI002AB308B9|nr:serine hydrolase [Paraburkholderia tropica]
MNTFKPLVWLALAALPLACTTRQHATTPATSSESANDTTRIATNAARFPAAQWRHADPASLGWSPARLADADAYARRVGATSLMIVQHGAVVDEWGDTQAKTPLYSVRKSLLSALIGIAVAQHQIDLDATLAQLGIDDNAPALTPTERQATVRELLEARSGVYHATTYETPWMQRIKPPRGSHAPGAFWCYNNWDFNALGGIYRQQSGHDIFTAFADEIARPIGMQDYAPSDGRYASGEPDTRYPAYPIDMSTRDLARFAWLYLNGGRWNGRQIVPSAWVEASTRPGSNTPWGGYGYMWWTSTPGDAVDTAGNTASAPQIASYWADGHLGQYAIVVPSLDLVVVSRVDPKQTSKHVSEPARAHLMTLIEAAAPPKTVP